MTCSVALCGHIRAVLNHIYQLLGKLARHYPSCLLPVHVTGIRDMLMNSLESATVSQNRVGLL